MPVDFRKDVAREGKAEEVGEEAGPEKKAEEKLVRFDAGDGLTDMQRRLTAGYSQESIVRIQNVFVEDRPATYGDEAGEKLETQRELHHISREKKEKIKIRAAAGGVVFSIMVKAIIILLIVSPLWVFLRRIESMSNDECLKDDYCKHLRFRLLIDESICPAAHLLVRVGILHDAAELPRGIWWNVEGLDRCIWLHSGRKVVDGQLSEESAQVSWNTAQSKCKLLHPRARLLTLDVPHAFFAVNNHLLMLQQLLTRKAQADQNMTFNNGLDYWIGLKRCKRNKNRYDYSEYVDPGDPHLEPICDLKIRQEGGVDVKNDTFNSYGVCGKIDSTHYAPWGAQRPVHEDLRPELQADLKRRGLDMLIRDVTMEEHAALVSFTEFASWWKSIYDRRKKQENFAHAAISYDYVESCQGDVGTVEEKDFIKDSLFQTFCVLLGPAMKNVKLFPEFYNFLAGKMKTTVTEEKKLLISQVKEFVTYSIPCDWKLQYICELDCNRTLYNDCQPKVLFPLLSLRPDDNLVVRSLMTLTETEHRNRQHFDFNSAESTDNLIFPHFLSLSSKSFPTA